MTSSNWKIFNNAIIEAHNTLRNNQYPKYLIERITNSKLIKIITGTKQNGPSTNTVSNRQKFSAVMPQYRGKVSEDFKKLDKLLPGSAFYFVSTKSRSKLCSLKEPVTFLLKSRVVYAITCRACAGTYIGKTIRHLSTRLKEHGMKNSPVSLHFQACNQKLTSADATIIDSLSDTVALFALEAIYIKRRKPVINSKEFRSHSLQYTF